MSRGRLILTNFIGIIVVLALIIGGAYYYYQSQNYVKTDEAKVQADMTQVVAPANGKLTEWNIKEGDEVSKDSVVGKIAGEQSGSVTATNEGTVIQSNTHANQLVQQGQVLAQVADLKSMYITANIEETDLKDIDEGDKVDVVVDGDSGTTYEGRVEKIGYATNSALSTMPSQSTSGNYTKVTQKVAVKISIKNPSDKIKPGMNASVKISL